MLSKTISVLLVEDHPHYINGLSKYLENNFHSINIFKAKSGNEALQKLKSIIFDITIIDIGLPDISGLEIVKYLNKLQLKTKIISNSYHYDSNQLSLLLKNNVDGILLKGDSEDTMAESIRSVLNNEKYYSDKIQPEIEKQKAYESNYSITETEYYILTRICQGKSSEQISFERNISINTVNTHKKRIFKKFNVHNAVELATLVANNEIR